MILRSRNLLAKGLHSPHLEHVCATYWRGGNAWTQLGVNAFRHAETRPQLGSTSAGSSLSFRISGTFRNSFTSSCLCLSYREQKKPFRCLFGCTRKVSKVLSVNVLLKWVAHALDFVSTGPGILLNAKMSGLRASYRLRLSRYLILLGKRFGAPPPFSRKLILIGRPPCRVYSCTTTLRA